MQLTEIVIFFIFGTLIGSFLNVVILRLPAEKKLSGRSACPNCGAGLVFYELLPVISYVFLRGKCRHCGKKISPRYFIIELVTGACFALVAWHFFTQANLDYMQLTRWLLAACLFVVIFVIDLEHFLILDKVIIFGSIAFGLFNLVVDLFSGLPILSIHSLLAGGILAGGISSLAFFSLWYISSGRWIGFGDVKLVFFLGLILGWPITFVMLLLSFWLGALVSLPLLFFRKKHLQSALPFGTFLTAGSFLSLFYGPAFLDWYLKLIGV